MKEEEEGGSSPSAPPLTPKNLTTLTSSPPIPASVFTVTTSVDIEVGSATATAPSEEEHEVVSFRLFVFTELEHKEIENSKSLMFSKTDSLILAFVITHCSGGG